MSELALPATTLFRFNSELLSLALSDLDDEAAGRRWKSGRGSSIAYLTGHLMSSRCGLLKTLGAARDNPYKGLFGEGVGSKEGAEYPSVGRLREEWIELAGRLHAALDRLTDVEALAGGDGSFPIPDNTLRGNLTFIAWHESYHIGQIGMMRTEMGYPSMRKTLYAARTSASD